MTLPAGWDFVAVGDLGAWRGGGTPSKSKPEYWSGDIPWVSAKDMKTLRISDAEDHITMQAVEESSTSVIPPKAVLLVTRSGILKHSLPVAVTLASVAINQDLKALIVRPGVIPEYVAWAFRAFSRLILHTYAKSGTTVQSIEFGRFKDLRIPLAPIAKQEQIVAAIEEQFSRLDSAEASILKAETRLRTFESQAIESTLQADWPTSPWKDVGNSQNGRAFPSRDYSAEGVRLLRPGNLHRSGRVLWSDSNTRSLPDVYAHQYPSYVVRAGEIVMNLTAQSLKDDFLGRVCMTEDEDGCLLNQRIARLTPSETLDRRFVYWVFRSRRFRRFVASLNTGSLIQHMFTSQIASFEVPTPPLATQRQACEAIERSLSIVEATEASLAKMRVRSQGLRRVILRDAFLGQVDAMEPEAHVHGVVSE